ncbi:hypothetical protein [Prauserella rugosa]|uniref:Uncharacterized protein n=1 Tax=Prauserella rugosa TaxID=43354 RepID=A0A660CGA5_9PSEU|nr:hypothetical protein [Prauserella rugosa]KMS82829.1 hypothetical protein ACZ91_56460 [Streptomyces regensis]TWH20549.1 hypothetical protein JD82_02395 [Prauserella rugosa]
MNSTESRSRRARNPGVSDTYCALLQQAAQVLRMRYVEVRRDTGLSAVEAEELAYLFERVVDNHPAGDQVDPAEAIALAHRVIDDDHPERSPLWPKAE